jgi:hypothetical protein
MTAIPSWLGATAGQATQAGQVNQFLGAHAATLLYAGVQKAAQTTAGSGVVNSNSLWLGQSFATASGQTAVGRAVLTLAVTGSPTPLTVGLYASSAGAPVGAALVSAAVPREFLTGSPAALSIPLPATVTASTTYWIVATAVGDVSNFFSWSKSNQVTGASTSANGTTWAAQAYGLLYQVFNQSTTGSPTHTFEDSGARWTSLGYSASNQLTKLAEYTVAQSSGYIQANRTLTYSGTSLTGVA